MGRSQGGCRQYHGGPALAVGRRASVYASRDGRSYRRPGEDRILVGRRAVCEVRSAAIRSRWLENGACLSGHIALAANEIDVTFHRVRVRLLSGRGQLLDRQRHRTNVRTPENGNPNAGYRFHDLAPSGSRLVGLRTTATNVLHSIQPIYAGKPQPPATLYGHPDGTFRSCSPNRATPSGAVVCKAWGCVEGLRVVFFRDGGNRLDPNDSYESASVGGRGGYQEMTLGGRGQPVVGIYGAAERELNSLGLIVACGDRRLPALPSNVVPLTRAQPLRRRSAAPCS